MILGVIMIHCNILYFVEGARPSFVEFTVRLFSDYLPAVAVPFFFFISAYLLQTKHPSVLSHDFGGFLAKRCRTLLIPYLLWNTIAVLFRILINLSPLNRYTSGGPSFDSFFGMLYDIYWLPGLSTMWFVRNLFIFVLLAPIMQLILRISPILPVICGYIIDTYTPGNVHGIFPPVHGMFYFTLGMAFAQWLKPEQFEKHISRLSWLVIFYCLINICLALFDVEIEAYPLPCYLLIMTGVFGFMALCSRPVPMLKKTDIPSMIFFMYAFHGIISSYVAKAMLVITAWKGGLLLIDYFAGFVITTVISFVAYYVCSRYFKRLGSVLTGGR